MATVTVARNPAQPRSFPAWVPIRRCGCRIVDRRGEMLLERGPVCELHPPLVPPPPSARGHGWDEIDPDEDREVSCQSCGGSGERAVGVGWGQWVLVALCRDCRADDLRAAHEHWLAAAGMRPERP